MFVLIVVMSIASAVYFNATGESRMKHFCDQVTPGMTHEQVREFALDNKLSPPRPGDGVSMLADPRSYGRHTCQVTVSGGVVTAVAQALAD
jgi:hypothetical protein